MVVLENSDYEKIADEVVAGYFSGTPLNDGILKVATDMGLNPNQIKQLVWQANTKAHLALFEKQAEDKCIEFPVADADYVMKRMYTPAEDQPLMDNPATDKLASDFFSPLEEVREKVASALEFKSDVEVSPQTLQRRKEAALRSMTKLLDELTFKTAELREEYVQDVYSFAWELRKQGNPENFEKDAHAIHGDGILPILNDLRSVYKRDPVTSEKLAASFDVLVNTKHPNMKKLAALKMRYTETVKCATSMQWLKAKLSK